MGENNVFINCPFDNTYFPLLKAVLFTVIYLDLNPLISETSDSGEVRLSKITDLMKNSKYSIHDLSRMERLKKGGLPRFNMPFECGIDFGIKHSNEALFGEKRFLILEKERFRYQRVISDISGNDISAHGNKPEKVVKSIRNWFNLNIEDVPMYRAIWGAFNEFLVDYDTLLTEQGYDANDISAVQFQDIIDIMRDWIEGFKAAIAR